MGIRAKLIAQYALDHDAMETCWFTSRLYGWDEEIWRTAENGQHYKIETGTGEITKGFGGQLNGKKVPSSTFFSHAWKSIATHARAHKDYTGWVRSLSNDQKSILETQYKTLKETGSKERFQDYAKRVHSMLTATASPKRPENKPVTGTDISKDYQWDGEPYTNPENGQVIDTKIEDIIHKQGFDGVPKVVSKEEFDRITKEHPEMPILLRSYSAPDADTLQSYDEMLEGGQWYVDCGVGGAQYGQGMYCAGVYGEDKKLDGALDEMEHYRRLNEQRCYGEQLAQYAEKLNQTDRQSVSENDFYGPDELVGREGYPDVIKTSLDDGVAYFHVDNEGKSIDQDGLSKLEPGYYLLTYENQDLSDLRHMKVIQVDADGKCTFANSGKDVTSVFGKIASRNPEIHKAEDITPQPPSPDNFAPKSSTRMMTLDPSAKIISYNDLRELRYRGMTPQEYEDARSKLVEQKIKDGGFDENEALIIKHYCGMVSVQEAVRISNEHPEVNWKELDERVKASAMQIRDDTYNEASDLARQREHQYDQYRDLGEFAAAMGYDAINADGHGQSNSYTVVLNRTKVILSEERVRVGDQ